jgi:hypothetical protein
MVRFRWIPDSHQLFALQRVERGESELWIPRRLPQW